MAGRSISIVRDYCAFPRLDASPQFKNDVHVFSLKFDVAPGHTARLTHNKSDLAAGVWSRCSVGGGPPYPLGRAQHVAG